MCGTHLKMTAAFLPINRRPAVFLDRDGVLAEEKGYIISVSQLCIFPYAEECVRKIHQKGYYAIVITNQSGVARGFISENVLKEMNRLLVLQTGVDAVYYCPHHEEGIVARYRVHCNCRKPQTELFEKARKEFGIDMENSWMVGDRASDIIAGKNIGIRTVLTETGYGTERLESPVRPDYIVKDLQEAVGLLDEGG